VIGEQMNRETFYKRVIQAVSKPTEERHDLLRDIHEEATGEYLQAVKRIAPGVAARLVAPGRDDRSLSAVVGHIAAWEQFAILGCGDILAGSRHPRMVTTVEGFITENGERVDFL
jgi:hypothetical protein